MTGPVPDPVAPPMADGLFAGTEPPEPIPTETIDALLARAEPTDEVAALERELSSGDGTRLARYSGRASTAVRILAILIAGTGVLALGVGLVGWRDEPIAMAAVAVLCLPAIVLPLYVARRTRALADAAGHPREMAAQAQDLVKGIRDSAELRRLAGRLTMRRSHHASAAGAARAVRAGRIRGALGLARLASTVIGQGAPDPARHSLLIPFTPERLTRTWVAAVWSLWAWLVAAVVLLVSLVALAVSPL